MSSYNTIVPTRDYLEALTAEVAAALGSFEVEEEVFQGVYNWDGTSQLDPDGIYTLATDPLEAQGRFRLQPNSQQNTPTTFSAKPLPQLLQMIMALRVAPGTPQRFCGVAQWDSLALFPWMTLYPEISSAFGLYAIDSTNVNILNDQFPLPVLIFGAPSGGGVVTPLGGQFATWYTGVLSQLSTGEYPLLQGGVDPGGNVFKAAFVRKAGAGSVQFKVDGALVGAPLNLGTGTPGEVAFLTYDAGAYDQYAVHLVVTTANVLSAYPWNEITEFTNVTIHGLNLAGLSMDDGLASAQARSNLQALLVEIGVTSGVQLMVAEYKEETGYFSERINQLCDIWDAAASTADKILVGSTPVVTVLSLTSLTWTAGVVTGVCTAPHSLVLGVPTQIMITGAEPAEYNGTYFATPSTATAFTYALADNPGAETVPGSMVRLLDDVNQRQINALTALTVAQRSAQAKPYIYADFYSPFVHASQPFTAPIYALGLGTDFINDGTHYFRLGRLLANTPALGAVLNASAGVYGTNAGPSVSFSFPSLFGNGSGFQGAPAFAPWTDNLLWGGASPDKELRLGARSLSFTSADGATTLMTISNQPGVIPNFLPPGPYTFTGTNTFLGAFQTFQSNSGSSYLRMKPAAGFDTGFDLYDNATRRWSIYTQTLGGGVTQSLHVFCDNAAIDAVLIDKLANVTLGAKLTVSTDLRVNGNVGFYNTAPVAKPAITGALTTVADAPAKAVLTSIIAALAALGLVTNSTT